MRSTTPAGYVYQQPCRPAMPLIGDVLDTNHLRIVPSPGDGHCLLHSFLTSWNNQFARKKQLLTLCDIIKCSTAEFLDNSDLYSAFINTDGSASHHQLDLYLKHKIYDQPIGDIFPYILANAYQTNICILDESPNKNCNVTVVPPRDGSTLFSLYLHRINDNHYNGLELSQLYQEYEPSTRYTYSRDDLLGLRSGTPVKRSVRKRLFRWNIWKPSGDYTKNVRIPKRAYKQITSNAGNLKVGVLNPCSACNKALLIRDLIVDEKLDILSLTETFQLNDSIIAELLPPGYNIVYNLRNDGRRGGGVAVIYRQELKCCTINTYNLSTLEAITARLTLASKTLHLCVVYAPESKTSSSASQSFITDFSPILYDDLCDLSNLLIVGDFNYHINKEDNIYAKDFLSLLESCDFHQHVTSPTHIKGNTLDLVITRDKELNPRDIYTDSTVSPDHYAVIFCLPDHKPEYTHQLTTVRRWKDLNVDDFKADIKQSNINDILNSDNLGDVVRLYDSVLQELLDKHAPAQQRTVKLNHVTPWYNENIRKIKQQRRQAERKWRKSKSSADRQTYRDFCIAANNELISAKRDYFHTKLSETTSQKDIYSISNDLLFGKSENPLPDHDNIAELVDRFADYFNDKIQVIRDDIAKVLNDSEPPELQSPDINEFLSVLSPASEEEVHRLIKRSATKSCDLDPLPTWLLKLCLEELLPVITHIINVSLSSGEVSPELKLALVIPLLKKALLDPEILKNFRPVSNLSYISKLIERVVADRLNVFLVDNGLHEPLQSAYKKYHSTETALLKVQNDILMSVDADGGAILVLLDLSAAFDTIDHEILLNRLFNLGVRDSALAWFRSYLTDRRQCVYIKGTKSKERRLPYGVPQGSVLGPILFTLYTTPLGNIARASGLKYHLYADDKQLYIAFKPTDDSSVALSIQTLQKCACDVKHWLTNNFLKCNGDKTDLLVVTNKKSRHKHNISSLSIDTDVITPSKTVRNLGAIFDSHMDSEAFVNSKCKSALHCLRNISRVRRSLTVNAVKTLIQAYITSRLDYCNCLLYGIPERLLYRLQKVQNYAARVVSLLPKRDHITPTLAELHWLPVKQRIIFKMLLLTYKCLHGQAPVYLADLLTPHAPCRSLRSANMQRLEVPPTRLRTYGDRSFAAAAPRLWNDLPMEVKCAPTVETFKSRLKTHLYVQAFEQELLK